MPTLLKYANQSIAIWHRLDNKNEESVAPADLALALSTMGDSKNGLKLAGKAKELAEKLNNLTERFRGDHNYGDCAAIYKRSGWRELIKDYIFGAREKLDFERD